MPETVADATVQDTPAGAAAATQSEPTTTATDKAAVTTDQGQPISYTDFALPEGMTLDAAQLTEIQTLFGDLKLPQEQAQRVIDQLVKTGPGLLKGPVEKMLLAEHEAQVKAWEAEARGAEDIGGAKFDASVAKAQTAIAAFATPGLKALLETYGLGSHPEVIRTFRGIGERISEGSHVSSQGDTKLGNPLESIYNHPTSKAALKYGT